jgi:hypothetical protein
VKPPYPANFPEWEKPKVESSMEVTSPEKLLYSEEIPF